MRIIPISEIHQDMHKIELQNGQTATLYQAIMTVVPEVKKNEEIMVLKYKIPCPLCGHENIGFSYDGKMFANIQLNCRWCGIFFRPVIKRD
jgi:transcription elongation factor Elf1